MWRSEFHQRSGRAGRGNDMKPESDKSSKCKVWKVVGGLALAALTAGLIANFQDIKRLIRIHTM